MGIVIAITGAIFFLCILAMTILAICGLPLGEFMMGGQDKVLPKKFRIIAMSMIPAQFLAIIIILQMGECISLWFSYNATKVICIVFASYLFLNTILNLFSKSKKERYIMTPLSLLASACFWITAFL